MEKRFARKNMFGIYYCCCLNAFYLYFNSLIRCQKKKRQQDEDTAALYRDIQEKFAWNDGDDDNAVALMAQAAQEGRLRRAQFAVLESIGQGQYGVVCCR